MSPYIPADSYLIFHHFVSTHLLKVGKVIKVKHPRYGFIVKRIKLIDREGLYWLEGLNISSLSINEMGAIKLSMIKGIVVYNIKKTKHINLMNTQ